jgi:hypothetical protein
MSARLRTQIERQEAGRMVMLFLGERATQTKTEASPKSHLIFDQSKFFPQIMMGLFDGKPGNREGTSLATVVASRKSGGCKAWKEIDSEDVLACRRAAESLMSCER